jgi:hypothetical protein
MSPEDPPVYRRYQCADQDFLREQTVPEHRNPGVVVLDVSDGRTDAAYRAAWFLGIIVGPFGRHWQRTKLVISASGEITAWPWWL